MSESSHIQPNFFGPRYGEQPKKKTDDWLDEPTSAPPPYSPVSHEPTSSRPTAHPSAPPLDIPNYGYYGSVPFPNTTSDASLPTWPWTAPPSSMPVPPPARQIYIPPPPPAPVSTKKSKNWCELFVQYLFYFFCICLVIRMVELLTRGGGYEGSCAHGIEWAALPKEFEFNKGIKIRTVGGHLSNGQIGIKTITPEDNLNTGTVQLSALIFPPRLADHPDLSYTLTHFINGTILEIYVPQELTRNACVSLNVMIYVPQDTPYIEIDVQNTRISIADETLIVPVVAIATTNAAIELHGSWEGQVLMLGTKNALIEFNQPILSSNLVFASTTNAAIRVRQPILATASIYLYTTNGAIDVDEFLYSDRAVDLTSSNSHINVKNVTGSRVEVRTSNGRINIDHGNAITMFHAQTTNGQINAHVDTGAHAEISIRTSNAEITASLPSDYEGLFNFETGSHNKINFVDEAGWSQIDSINKGHISGRRIEPGHTELPNSRVQVMTSNANAHIHF